MSIAERIGEIDLQSTALTEKGASQGTPSLQTDNFAVLLVQGLESGDSDILNVSIPLGVSIRLSEFLIPLIPRICCRVPSETF